MCPRKAAVETRVYCDECREFTPTIGPIVLKRKKGANYYLKSVCGSCNNVKPFKHLNKLQVKAFPEDLRNMSENSETTASEPPAELSQINETLSSPLAIGNGKLSENESQRVTSQANDLNDATDGGAVLARSLSETTTVAIVDAIELLEANGFTVLVS
jgi:hypothetical protein